MEYKLLTLCGNFIKVNRMTKKQVTWVEETRCCRLEPAQKSILLEAMDADPQVAENPDLMAIAIEFRLKPLISANSVAGQRQSGGESKAFKQLKQDCAQLKAEHPHQVCFTTDPAQVEQAAQLVFR